MKKLIFTFSIIVCALLSSCNNSNCEITYSSKSCVTLGNIEEWGAEIKSHEFNNGLGKITFNGKVTNVPESAFRDCTSLKSITLPNSITSIGYYAFLGCENLKTIKLPTNLKTIENCAFYKCTSLASITIPDSVTEIGWKAFYNCHWLGSVYCKATTPPTRGSNVFSEDDYRSKPIGCKIYVPRNSVEAYKSAEGWKEYAEDIVGYDF